MSGGNLLNKIKKHKELKESNIKALDNYITTPNYKNVVEDNNTFTKRRWRDNNPTRSKSAQKKELVKNNKKCRYLVEKYHKEIGLKILKFRIIDPFTGMVKDEFIKEHIQKLKEQ